MAEEEAGDTEGGMPVCDVWKAVGCLTFAGLRRPWDGWALSAGSEGPGSHTITPQHP